MGPGADAGLLRYLCMTMRLSELEAISIAVYPPRPFEDPYNGKARMLSLRIDEVSNVAYQIDLAHKEYRQQMIGPGPSCFGPWLPLETETVGVVESVA
jgi:hypothetical protein